jgi:hypothetical protein
MSISTDREKSCVPRGRTRTGAASATSTRTRRVAPGADDDDADDADDRRRVDAVFDGVLRARGVGMLRRACV